MSFELNLASLPNHVLYLEGVQLSHIKVFVHIFNLWQSDKPCFITNPEFQRRTGLHKDTIIGAITFLEKHGLLKRVTKGRKRYLVQCVRVVEIEEESVDKSDSSSANYGHGSEIDLRRVGVRPSQGSELDLHNNKYNNNNKKSSCASHETEKPKLVDNRKNENEKRHSYTDKRNELQCTAKFWGPGHPDYDRINNSSKRTA